MGGGLDENPLDKEQFLKDSLLLVVADAVSGKPILSVKAATEKVQQPSDASGMPGVSGVGVFHLPPGVGECGKSLVQLFVPCGIGYLVGDEIGFDQFCDVLQRQKQFSGGCCLFIMQLRWRLISRGRLDALGEFRRDK